MSEEPGSLSDEQVVRVMALAGDLARQDRARDLQDFIEHGLPVDAVDSEGNSLLMLAAYAGATETVRVLLARGADPNLLNARGQSIVAGALFKGENEIVQQLLAAGADLDIGTPSAREAAAMFGQQHLLDP